MILGPAKNFIDTLEHEHIFMFSLILVELFCIALIHLLPNTESETRQIEYYAPRAEFFVEDVIITKQPTAPASPPRPQVPVPVPNDQIVEEIIEFPDFDDLFSEDPIQIDEDGIGRKGDSGTVVGSPDQPPSVVRIVEPTIPDAAKRADIKAEIIVSFLVDTNGNVEEVIFSEIRIYDGDTYEVVNDIGYGIMEAIMEAASKWRFRPANHEGEPVKTFVKNSFSIGF